MSEKKREVRMRAANLRDFELSEAQKNELIQTLKTENLVLLEPDEYYVMKGYHLISWFETLIKLHSELDKTLK